MSCLIAKATCSLFVGLRDRPPENDGQPRWSEKNKIEKNVKSVVPVNAHGIKVFVKDLDCKDCMENIYYSVDHEAVCFFCGRESTRRDDVDYHPQCNDCSALPPVKKRA
jgi:hypothetical protein